MAKDDDKQPIVEEEETERNEVANGHINESQPIKVKQIIRDKIDEKDRKELRLIIIIGTVISLLLAVALGIGYAAGDKQLAVTGLVTSDCAPCADMGLEILKSGGSAVDAVVTTTLCNGLVNMHSSGIGGGGFMIIRDHKNNKSTAIDFRSAAPSGATQELYKQGVELFKFGPLAVAVPGEVSGLALAHKYYGKLPWAELVEPVSKLARSGFQITEDVYHWMKTRSGLLDASGTYTANKLRSLLVDENGQIKPAGTVITREDYAQALDMIAEDPMNLYRKESDIVKDITSATDSRITEEDMASYGAKYLIPLKATYKDFTLETVPPPAGGVITLHTLKLMERFESKTDDDLTYHRMVEAMKFGFAAFPNNHDFESDDARDNFTSSMLDSAHCHETSMKINDTHTQELSYYDVHYQAAKDNGTSAITVIDNNELYVSSISSLNDLFGSAVMTDKYGIILNNDMDDFDKNYTAVDQLVPEALRTNPGNLIKGGRRPRSSMSPVVFYRTNEKEKCGLRGAVAGVGGQKIITESFPVERRNYLRTKGHEIQLLEKRHYLAVISAGTKRVLTLDGQGDYRKQGKSVQFEH